MYPPTPSAGHQAVGGNPSTQAWNPAMLLGGEVGKGGERGLGPMHTLADFRLIMLVHVASLWLSSQTQKASQVSITAATLSVIGMTTFGTSRRRLLLH